MTTPGDTVSPGPADNEIAETMSTKSSRSFTDTRYRLEIQIESFLLFGLETTGKRYRPKTSTKLHNTTRPLYETRYPFFYPATNLHKARRYCYLRRYNTYKYDVRVCTCFLLRNYPYAAADRLTFFFLQRVTAVRRRWRYIMSYGFGVRRASENTGADKNDTMLLCADERKEIKKGRPRPFFK